MSSPTSLMQCPSRRGADCNCHAIPHHLNDLWPGPGVIHHAERSSIIGHYRNYNTKEIKACTYSMPRRAQYSSRDIYWSFSLKSFLYCQSTNSSVRDFLAAIVSETYAASLSVFLKGNEIIRFSLDECMEFFGA